MPLNGYSIGRDITIVITTASGANFNFGKVLSFEPKQKTKDEEIIGLDGITDNLLFPIGWTFAIDMERQNSDVDAYFAQYEANFRAGIDNGVDTLQATILEPDQSVSQWRYERVVLKYDDAGKWSGDSGVKQKISGMASARIQQA